MIFLTDDERFELEEFLIQRQWKPGKRENSWISFKFHPVHQCDMPFFLIATEKKSETMYEVGAMGIGNDWGDGPWTDEQVRIHLEDILKAGTFYGTRISMQNYLAKIGVPSPDAHAHALMAIWAGDADVPAPIVPMERTFFFDGEGGWMKLEWKGGELLFVTMSIQSYHPLVGHNEPLNKVDGYSIYQGVLRSAHGNKILYHESVFGERRQVARANTADSPESGRADQPESKPDSGLP